MMIITKRNTSPLFHPDRLHVETRNSAFSGSLVARQLKSRQPPAKPITSLHCEHLMWPNRRAKELNEKLQKLLERDRISYTFLPSQRLEKAYKSGYFPSNDELGRELAELSPAPFVFVPEEDHTVDLAIVTNHGAPGSAEDIWDVRRRLGEQAIIAVWHWDNHVAWVSNLQAALAADIVFVSHAYASDYLHTPASLVSQHIPACSVQWTRKQAIDFFRIAEGRQRRHKLLVNYVAHPNSESPLRKRVLEEYRSGLSEADVFIMNKEERSRYFDLSPRDRFLNWANYKSTVIVPMVHDLSTRFFDALLAGQVPIVPRNITDFDDVIPEEAQDRLGIVRVESLEVESIREAAKQALDRYDELGIVGAQARHNYALENHTLANRIEQMLYMIWLIGQGELTIEFANAHYGSALYQKARKATHGP